MQPSKMQLERYFVEEVSFNLQSEQFQNLEGIPKLDSTDLDIEVKLGESKDNENKRYCQLTINLNEAAAETFPYKFKVVLVGFFELDASCSEEDTSVIMTNTAPSMLYTAAREYLLLITGRTRFLPVMLPTVIFLPKKEKAADKPKVIDSGSKQVSAKKSKSKTAKKTE